MNYTNNFIFCSDFHVFLDKLRPAAGYWTPARTWTEVKLDQKYKITAMLRDTESVMEAVARQVSKPTLGTVDDALMAYNTELLKYRKAESNTLLIFTSNMTDKT